MKTLLVTGATTPLGRRVVQQALLDHPAAGVLAVGIEPAQASFGELDSERLRYRRVDLTRPREVHDLLFGLGRELGVDAVIHAALHRSARDTGAKVHAQNVESTRELLALSERHPTIERFVFRSHGSVYRIDPRRASLISEDDPLELGPEAPQSVRDRVEADITVATRVGRSDLGVVVLRCAEVLAARVGSQLFDYLSSRLCLRPLGFDPMLNVLSLEDAARALVLAASSQVIGVFNVPGADTLPLSRAIELWGRRGVPVPGPLLAPLYRARASALGMEFRYDLNHRRFHFGAVLDGTLAQSRLGYHPHHPIAWPAKTAARVEASSRPPARA